MAVLNYLSARIPAKVSINIKAGKGSVHTAHKVVQSLD